MREYRERSPHTDARILSKRNGNIPMETTEISFGGQHAKLPLSYNGRRVLIRDDQSWWMYSVFESVWGAFHAPGTSGLGYGGGGREASSSRAGMSHAGDDLRAPWCGLLASQ